MRLFQLRLALLGLAGGVLMAGAASAQCPAADIYEDNDDCLTPTPVTVGTYSTLTVQGAGDPGGIDEDHYSITVANGEILTVDALFLDINGDIDVYLYESTAPNCGGEAAGDYLVRGFSATDNETIAWGNSTGGPVTYIIRVELYATTDVCNDYDLVIATAPDPCQGSDDSLEDNDDCATATPMVDGTTPALFVSKTDHDYYEMQVADGDSLTVDMLFTDALGDLDMELYISQADCLTDTSVTGSYSVSDNESVSYTNTSGGLLTMVLHVYHYQGDAAADCNVYDLVITGSGGSVGTPMCAGDGTVGACPCGNESALGAGEGCNHSGGVGATISVAGTASVATDDIAFSIAQAIPNQPSLLVQGESLIAVPFKDGLLCMGNPTERVEVVFLDANGEGTTASSIVTEGNVSAGDTRHYQFWYRNPGGVSPCGSGSNFSSGLTVVYVP